MRHLRKRQRKEFTFRIGWTPRLNGAEIHWHGMTLTEIAHRAGLSIAGVSRIYRRERDPRFETMVKIAGVLGVTIEQLHEELVQLNS